MGLYKTLKKRIEWLKNVRFDQRTGFYTYKRFGKDIYIRHPKHFLRIKDNLWFCEKLFFYYYQPQEGDVIVDLGAGYGEEAVYMAHKTAKIKYIGVEAQPVIYECLANTFNGLGDGFVASPFVISGQSNIRFASQFAYASVGETQQGYIEVPEMRWDEFKNRYQIEHIDLFKMNIEGAEKEIFDQIMDFSGIRRFIISCHDFRANKGHGEWFRTRQAVTEKLLQNGYTLKTFNYGISWADDWIYAEKNP